MHALLSLPRHLLSLLDLFYNWVLITFYRLTKSEAEVDQWLRQGFITWAQRMLARYKFQFEVRGREHLDGVDWQGRHVFFVGNHQSYMDIPALLAAAERPVGFLAKKELWKIPFLGFWMEKLGCVGVDRSKPSAAIRTLKEFEKRGEHKRLSLFPEGTRSKDGRLGEFKEGGLKLVWSLKPIVVPIVIQGTRQGIEDPGRPQGNRAVVTILPAIDIASLPKNGFDDWMQSLRQSMEQCLEQQS